MKQRTWEVTGATAGGLVALASVILVGLGAPGFPWGSTLVAVVAVVASVVILTWVVLDDATRFGSGLAWILGGVAGLVIGFGSLADYWLWFEDSRLWTVGCHAIALILVAAAGIKGGWAGGLRAALVGHLLATPILLLVFWWNLGIPLQAAVFQAAGVLDSYAASKGTLFAPWVRSTFLWAVLPRTLVALGVGFGLGYGVDWLKKNRKSAALTKNR